MRLRLVQIFCKYAATYLYERMKFLDAANELIRKQDMRCTCAL